jgi:hypothetical protein
VLVRGRCIRCNGWRCDQLMLVEFSDDYVQSAAKRPKPPSVQARKLMCWDKRSALAR